MTPTKAPDADSQWEWEELGWIALDAGVCFFGARATLPSGRRLPLKIGQRVGTHSALLATSDGYRVVACGTAADLSMPVEVALVNGRRVAARMEFVDDVAEVDGVWEVVGTFELPREVAAGDPMCAGGTYRLEFDIEPGTYRADIFKPAENPWDTLGLRIVLIEPPGLEP